MTKKNARIVWLTYAAFAVTTIVVQQKILRHKAKLRRREYKKTIDTLAEHFVRLHGDAWSDLGKLHMRVDEYASLTEDQRAEEEIRLRCNIDGYMECIQKMDGCNDILVKGGL